MAKSSHSGARCGRSTKTEQAGFRSSQRDGSQPMVENDTVNTPYRSRTLTMYQQTPPWVISQTLEVTNTVCEEHEALEESADTKPQTSKSNITTIPQHQELDSMSPKSICSELPSPFSENTSFASIEPPITKTSLGELDLQRIFDDPKLRHDLNFEREIAFRPNYYGPKGAQKKAMARAYWGALAEDLVILYSRDRSTERTTGPESSTCTQHSTHARLRQMFNTLSDILKSLVPDAESIAIEQTLDVDLILQQLEKGVCDLVRLSEWLAKLLMGSCSPCRDPLVQKMVSCIQDAALEHDAKKLVEGIEQLFCILETMKLDVANHQIRELKFLMFENNVPFERTYFDRRIKLGLRVDDAADWYSSAIQQAMRHEQDGFTSCLDVFARAAIDLVISHNPHFPSTFVFDTERLRALQGDVRNFISQETYNKTFIGLLDFLGHTSDPSSDVSESLLKRISKIADFSWTKGALSAQSEDGVLEVVRAAYNVCKMTSLPTDEHVAIAKLILMDVRSTQYQDLKLDVRSDLEVIVNSELSKMWTFTPLQIHKYYQPQSPQSWLEYERDSLQGIGERLAHIIILHWRTWAPILYLRHSESKAQSQAPTRTKSTRMRRNTQSAPNLGLLQEPCPQSSVAKR